MENAVSHFKDRGTYILLAVESTSTLHHTLSDGAEVASSPGSFLLSVRGKGPGYEASTEDLCLVPPALVLLPCSRVWAAAQELGKRLPHHLQNFTIL